MSAFRCLIHGRALAFCTLVIACALSPSGTSRADYSSQARAGSARNNFYLNALDVDGDSHGVYAYHGKVSSSSASPDDGLVVPSGYIAHAAQVSGTPTLLWDISAFLALPDVDRELGNLPASLTSTTAPGPGLGWALAGPPDIEDAAANTIVLPQNQIVEPGAPGGTTPGSPQLNVVDAGTGLSTLTVSVTSPGLPATGTVSILDSLNVPGTVRVLLLAVDDPPASRRFFVWSLPAGDSIAQAWEITGVSPSALLGSLAHLDDGDLSSVAVVFATSDELFVYTVAPTLAPGPRITLTPGPGGEPSSGQLPRVASTTVVGGSTPLRVVVLRSGPLGGILSAYDSALARQWNLAIGSGSSEIEEYDIAVAGGNPKVFLLTYDAAAGEALVHGIDVATGAVEWQSDPTDHLSVAVDLDAMPRLMAEGLNSLNVNVLSTDIHDILGEAVVQLERNIRLREYAADGSTCADLVMDTLSGDVVDPPKAVTEMAMAFRDGRIYSSVYFDDGSLDVHVAEKRAVDLIGTGTEVTQAIQDPDAATRVPLVVGKDAALRIYYRDQNALPTELWAIKSPLCDTISAQADLTIGPEETGRLTIFDGTLLSTLNFLQSEREDERKSINLDILGVSIPDAGAGSFIRTNVSLGTEGLEEPSAKVNNGSGFGLTDHPVYDVAVPDPCLISYAIRAFDDTVTEGEWSAAALEPDPVLRLIALNSLANSTLPMDYLTNAAEEGPAQVDDAVARLPVAALETSEFRATLEDGGAPYYLPKQKPHFKLWLRTITTNDSRFCANTPAFHVGFFPEGAAADNPGAQKLAGEFITVSGKGAGDVVAHEMGHVLGRRHVGFPFGSGTLCDLTKGQDRKIDTSYPYHPCRISDDIADELGLWGTDISGGNDHYEVYRPDIPGSFARGPAGDLMSYANVDWVSDYTFLAIRDALLDRYGLSPSPAASGGGGASTSDEWLVVSGSMDLPPDLDAIEMGSLQVERVLSLPASLVDPEAAASVLAWQQTDAPTGSEPRLEVRATGPGDPVGSVVELPVLPVWDASPAATRVPFVALASIGACGCIQYATVRVTDMDTGQFVERSRSPNSPSVTLVGPAQASYGLDEFIEVAWTASDPDGDPLSYFVQFSDDGGATWIMVEDETKATSALVPAGAVSFGSSTTGVFRVTAMDGFNTASDVGQSITIIGNPTGRPAAPLVAIARPLDGAAYTLADDIPCIGEAHDYQDGALPNASYEWMNGPLVIGQGLASYIPASSLGAGVQSLILRVTDSDGNSSTDTVTLYVPEPGGTLGLVSGIALLGALSRRTARRRRATSRPCSERIASRVFAILRVGEGS